MIFLFSLKIWSVLPSKHIASSLSTSYALTMNYRRFVRCKVPGARIIFNLSYSCYFFLYSFNGFFPCSAWYVNKILCYIAVSKKKGQQWKATKPYDRSEYRYSSWEYQSRNAQCECVYIFIGRSAKNAITIRRNPVVIDRKELSTAPYSKHEEQQKKITITAAVKNNKEFIMGSICMS